MVTKFVGGAPLDVMWVSDSWLPEWAEAGWIAPVDEHENLMAYNAEAEDFCTNSMTYGGRQYGLTYYTDFMAFLYDEAKLEQAGFSAPPETWDEVVEQSLAMKEQGIADFPLMLAMGAGKLADRVPVGDGVLARRTVHRRPGRRPDGPPDRRLRAGAEMGGRRGSTPTASSRRPVSRRAS